MARLTSEFSDEITDNDSWRHPNPNGIFTAQNLRPVNDLTRTAAIPGEIQYQEYARYLMRLGHVKPEHSQKPHPTQPQTSILQANIGDRNDDRTDFRAEQALWTMDNLPDILYALGKPPGWLSVKELNDAPLKPYLIHGKQLNDIPILPDHISSELEGWRYEAWVRMDPRIGYTDIEARIVPSERAKHKSRIQMRAKRFRDNFPLHGWVTKGKNFETDRQKLVHALQRKGVDINRNTTRGLSWGLVNKHLGETGGRVQVPEASRQLPFVDTSGVSFTPLPSSFSLPATGFGLMNSTHPSVSQTLTSSSSITTITSYTTTDQTSRMTPAVSQTMRKRSRSDDITEDTSQSSKRSRHQPGLVVLDHEGYRLVLRTPAERAAEYSPEVTQLLSTWYPSESEERRRQLEWILDPARAINGFWDVHHWKADSNTNMAANCTDHDVVYADEVLPEHRGMTNTVHIR